MFTAGNILLFGLLLLVLAIPLAVTIVLVYAGIRFIDYKFPKKMNNTDNRAIPEEEKVSLDDIPSSKKKKRKKVVEDMPMEIGQFQVTSSFDGKRIGQIKGE